MFGAQDALFVVCKFVEVDDFLKIVTLRPTCLLLNIFYFISEAGGRIIVLVALEIRKCLW